MFEAHFLIFPLSPQKASFLHQETEGKGKSVEKDGSKLLWKNTEEEERRGHLLQTLNGSA